MTESLHLSTVRKESPNVSCEYISHKPVTTIDLYDGCDDTKDKDLVKKEAHNVYTKSECRDCNLIRKKDLEQEIKLNQQLKSEIISLRQNQVINGLRNFHAEEMRNHIENMNEQIFEHKDMLMKLDNLIKRKKEMEKEVTDLEAEIHDLRCKQLQRQVFNQQIVSDRDKIIRELKNIRGPTMAWISSATKKDYKPQKNMYTHAKLVIRKHFSRNQRFSMGDIYDVRNIFKMQRTSSDGKAR